MPFGTMPYASDGLDKLVRRRLEEVLSQRLGNIPPAVSAMNTTDSPESQSYGDLMGAPTLEAAPKPRGSVWRRSLAATLGPRGQRGIGAGIRAGRESRGFGGGFLAGLGASLESGTSYDAAQAESAKAAAEDASKGQLDEMGTLSRFIKQPSTSETTGQELEAQSQFLKAIGFSDEEIKSYFMQKGVGGRGAGGGRETDLDKVAKGLLDSSQASTMGDAYVKAKTILQQPQMVGQVERFISDPNNLDNFIRTRLNVYRRYNPLNGEYETVDEMGRPVSEADVLKIRTDPGAFMGGTKPPTAQRPGRVGLQPSHAPTGVGPAPLRPTAADFDTR